MKIGDEVTVSRHIITSKVKEYSTGVLHQREGTIIGIRKKLLGGYRWVIRLKEGIIIETRIE